MLLNQPTNLSEAVKVLLAKQVLPTTLDSAGIRQWDAGLRAQSLFSAQTANQYLLERYRTLLQSILSGEQVAEPGGVGVRAYNPLYARENIQDFLRSIRYLPPQGKEGTIQDLSSDARVRLVLDTNRDMALGQGWWMEGQQEAILDQWPAQELFRAEARAIPRDWLARWRTAGDATGDPIGTGWTITPDFRMIALKNHPIWEELGSSENFDDALDTVWPPFAFRSGMWVRDVERELAEQLGLIEAGEKVEPLSLEDVLKN